MIDFSELNETQKNYVVYIIERFKHISKHISLVEMKSYHETMLYERDKGGPKYGYPNWLIVKENKVEMSLYSFPAPSGEQLASFLAGDVVAHINLKKYSQMLQDVVQKYNLKR